MENKSIVIQQIYTYTEEFEIPYDDQYLQWCLDNGYDSEAEQSMREYFWELNSDGSVESTFEDYDLVHVEAFIDKNE